MVLASQPSLYFNFLNYDGMGYFSPDPWESMGTVEVMTADDQTTGQTVQMIVGCVGSVALEGTVWPVWMIATELNVPGREIPVQGGDNSPVFAYQTIGELVLDRSTTEIQYVDVVRYVDKIVEVQTGFTSTALQLLMGSLFDAIADRYEQDDWQGAGVYLVPAGTSFSLTREDGSLWTSYLGNHDTSEDHDLVFVTGAYGSQGVYSLVAVNPEREVVFGSGQESFAQLPFISVPVYLTVEKVVEVRVEIPVQVPVVREVVRETTSPGPVVGAFLLGKLTS